MIRHVVIVCEDGWEGIRRFALLLSENSIPVSVIIKGDPGKEVREMITHKPGVRNYFFGRRSYRILLLPLLFWLKLKHRWDVCCITKERTYQSLRKLENLLNFELYLFLDNGKDSSLVGPDKTRIIPGSLLTIK